MIELRVVFSKNRHWWALGSRFLMWVEGVPFSHVSLSLFIPGGYMYEPQIFESVYPRSRKITYSEWIKKYHPVKEFEFTVGNEAYEMFSKLHNLLDRKYSVWQLVKIGMQLIAKGFNKSLFSKDWGCEKHQICTEFVARVFAEPPFNMFKDMSPDIIGLKETYREFYVNAWTKE